MSRPIRGIDDSKVAIILSDHKSKNFSLQNSPHGVNISFRHAQELLRVCFMLGFTHFSINFLLEGKDCIGPIVAITEYYMSKESRGQ